MEHIKCAVAARGDPTTAGWRRLARFLVAVFTLFTLVTAVPLSTAATPIVSATSGIREVITSGSINVGSNQLTVASAAGFNVGDWVIVEIGNEAGQGQRGTRGVGGTWPWASAPTEAQLFARDPGQGGYMWAEDTGYVFFRWDGVWYSTARERENHWYTGSYYLGKAVPRSLQARITSISGTKLTLDRSAEVSTSNATVYFDNAPLISNLISQQGSVTLPAGNFPIGGVVWIVDKSGVTLSGQGKDQTRLYTPKGVPGAIEARNSPNTIIQNLTLQGNWGDSGFALNWDSSTAAGEMNGLGDYIGGLMWPNGIMLDRGTNDSEVRDVRVINVAQNAVGSSFTSNTWARRVENIQTNIPRDYLQWQFKWGDATGGGTEDTVMRATYVLPGWESFKSSGVSHIRVNGTNGLMSANGSGGFLFDAPQLYFTANAFHPESDPIASSVFQPIININTNIGITSYVAQGGTVRNVRIIQEGKINGYDNLEGIVVNTNNPNIRIEGGYFQAPDWTPGGVTHGTQAINSTAHPNAPVIDGFVAVGRSSTIGAEQFNVYNLYGGLANCVAWNSYPYNVCRTPDQSGVTAVASSAPTAVIPSFGSTSTTTTPASGGGTSTSTTTTPSSASPNGTRGTQVVDSTGAVWTFQGSQTLRNGVWVGYGDATEYLYLNSTVYAIVGTYGVYKWTGDQWSYAAADVATLQGSSSTTTGSTSGSTTTGSTSGSTSGSTTTGSTSTTTTASANGTRGTQVVDATGAVWTFEGSHTLRNGVWVGYGDATEYLYLNSTVYAIVGTYGVYKWMGDQWSYAAADVATLQGSSSTTTGSTSGSTTTGSTSGSTTTGSTSGSTSGSTTTGSTTGSTSGSTTTGSTSGSTATPTTSANGTRGKQVVDATGAVWTFDVTHTLRNGVWVGYGDASEYLYFNSTVYAIAGDGLWKWNGTGWVFAGIDVAAVEGTATTGNTSGSTAGQTTTKLPSVASDFSGKRTSAVLWRNSSTGGNAIWTVDKGAVTTTSNLQSAGSTWQAAGIGDFNGDGKADILWRDNSGAVVAWLMDNTNVAQMGSLASVPTSWKVAGVADFDGDGKADVLWRATDGTVAVWLMDGLTVKSNATLVSVASTWTVGGVGDLNKDGKADIVWRNTDGTVVTWLMDGGKVASMTVSGTVTSAWSIAAVADYNGDGKADILWRNGTTGENAIWFMNGSTTTSSAYITGVTDTRWKIVAAGDYDGDGKADILWRHSKTGDNQIWLMNGGVSKSATQIPTLKDTNWTVVKP